MKEQLSCLVDGELDKEACTHLLRGMKHQDSLYAQWATYQLIGDAMREEAHVLSVGFEQRIMQAIQDEPTILAPTQLQIATSTSTDTAGGAAHGNYKTSWFLSAAASVAAVFFVGWMVMNNQVSHQDDAMSPVQIAQSSTEPVQLAQIPSEYLLAHQSYAPSGVSSYIQTASYSESAE